MEELIKFAVNLAVELGASYSEARLQEDWIHTITLRNGSPESAGIEKLYGIGVRVLVGGALAFAATNNLTREGVRAVVERAFRMAKASGKLLERPVRLSQEALGEGSSEVKVKEPLGSISDEAKLSLLREVDRAITSEALESKFPVRVFTVGSYETRKHLITSDGADVRSYVPRIDFMFVLTGFMPGKGTVQRIDHLAASKGWEAIKEWDPVGYCVNEAKVLDEILRKGVEPPKGQLDMVLGPEITGIICHESCGHPQEADRVLGREAAQAGESYVKPDMMGHRVGSEFVTVVDDPALPSSYGFYEYDDEGVKPGRRVLIERGRISGLLHNRETAYEFGVRSNGSSRSAAYNREPIVRMANTFMLPGDYSLEELLEGVKFGVYMKSYMEWNIDDKRFNQRYVGLEAYLVENGEVKGLLRNPALEITTPALYSSVDAVGKDLSFKAGTCGKGDPSQGIPVWLGGPSIRLRGVTLR